MSAKNGQVVLAQVKEKQYFCSGILKYRQALAIVLTRSVTSLELEQDKPAECGGYKKNKIMAKEYYCYPREGFEPEVCTHEGLSLAHAQGTPFWLSEKGDVFIRYANGRWHRRIVDTCARKSYNTRTLNGVIRGKTYPGVTYKGVHYRVHILMALAWIGSIPAGWEVDHLNGDINNWTRDNIRIVTVAENYRCAVILRARRMVARQDNDPSKLPENMKAEELLALFSKYNVAGDCYEGE